MDTIIDVDVHHSYDDESELVPYLPKGSYRDRFREYGLPSTGVAYGINGGFQGVRADLRDETNSEEGPGIAGGTMQEIQTDLLEEHEIDTVILTGRPVYGMSSINNIEYANVLCRAFNDYTIEEWLPADDRFKYAMAINHQDPSFAAEEIDRVGSHPDIVGVVMPPSSSRPFGNKRYDQIYELSIKHDLVVMIHTGNLGGVHGQPPTAAGYPSHYIEHRLTARHPLYQAHLASFIFEGTFEKFLDLRVAMIECGWSWVPSFLWRMDTEWRALRTEVPWVERKPSEYIKEHVRWNTQPIEEPESIDQLLEIIEWMDGDDLLMFASDFPHWDFDNPERTLTELDPESRRSVFAENAREFFNI